jgi:hypothetical protein
VLRNTTQIQGTGFIGLDGTSNQDDASIQAFIDQFFANQVQRSELHPDAWSTIIIHDPADTFKKLSEVAGDKYSYAEIADGFLAHRHLDANGKYGMHYAVNFHTNEDLSEGNTPWFMLWGCLSLDWRQEVPCSLWRQSAGFAAADQL